MALEPPQTSTDDPIPVHIAGDKVYVYNVDSIRRLRVDHHITGITLGTLPQVAQQNVFLGVPLQLLPEEVAVLVEQRIAYLVDDKLAHARATPEEASAYAELRKKAIVTFQDQALQAEEEKTKLMKEKYKDQIEKRQKERSAKKEKQRLANLEAGVGIGVDVDSDVRINQESTGGAYEPATTSTEATLGITSTSSAKKDSSHIPFSIITPTTSDGRDWYTPDPLSHEITPQFPDATLLPQHSDTRSTFFLLDSNNHNQSIPTLSPAKTALAHVTKRGQSLNAGSSGGGGTYWNDGSGATSLPGGDEEMMKLKEARIRVYKDLWMKGYFMGSGLKFGADFLVYPGDPLRFHSHFVCTVLPSPLANIAPLDIVAWGRLATAVKKAHLIASWDEKKGEVEYLSLEWSGFG